MSAEVHSGIVLALCEASYSYQTTDMCVPAVTQASLDVRQGELVALKGRSGSGKSTVLAMAGGLLKPATGQVHIKGQDPYGLPERQSTEFRRRHIGFIFQEYNLVRTLTVLENVSLIGELNGVGRKAARVNALDALETVGVRELCDRFPSELSGGQQQRVAVARAVAERPTVILADEPTGAIDTASAESVIGLLESLVQSRIERW